MDNEIIEKFIELGLTKGEAKVYFALSNLYESKVGAIVQESGVSSSKVYEILKRLVEKGLICEKIQDNTKMFKYLGTDKLKILLRKQEHEIKNRKQILEKTLPKLNMQTVPLEKEGDVQILEGMEGFKATANQVIHILKEGDTFDLLVGIEKFDSFPFGFFYEWHKNRIKKGIKVRVLCHPKCKGLANLKKKFKLVEIRTVKENITAPIIIGIGRNFVGHMVIKPKIKITVLFGETISQHHAKYFENLWENFSKKCNTN